MGLTRRVLLADAEEVHELPVQIIQYLDLRRFLVEQDLSTVRERFDIRRVLREHLNQPLRKRALPTYI